MGYLPNEGANITLFNFDYGYMNTVMGIVMPKLLLGSWVLYYFFLLLFLGFII